MMSEMLRWTGWSETSVPEHRERTARACVRALQRPRLKHRRQKEGISKMLSCKLTLSEERKRKWFPDRLSSSSECWP